MTQRYLATLLLCSFGLLLMPDLSAAQGIRPEKTMYLKPRVGVAWYLSDTEQSPFTFITEDEGNFDNWKGGRFPYAAGLEIGYQFNQSSSLSLGWQMTNHPLVFFYGTETAPEKKVLFNAAQLLYRIGTTGRVAPFFGIGAHAIFGQDGRSSPGFGPAVALGLDIVLNDRISLVLENTSNLVFGDEALDNAKDVTVPAGTSDFGPFDVSSAVTLGLKINFKSAFTPVDVTGITCPSALEVGQAGTFSITTNDDATQPVMVTWNFGDGGSGSGVATSYTFTRAGTYTVTATAENGRASDSESCTVTVTAPVPAEIVTVTASPQSFEICEGQPVTVQFSANVRGDQPITYSWDFGDGTTATGATASHAYSQVGTYTVTLTATNEAGTSTRSLTVTANPCTSGVCFEITEMNSVFFDRNSSALSDEARAALRENLEIFQECPNLCGRIEGFAGPGERNAQQLSEDRARAVQQFYIDNGIEATRLTATGRGAPEGQTTKKEGTSQLRRADTIPVQCVDLNR